MEDNERGKATDGSGDAPSGRADQPKTCANCGEPIDMKDWHPVVTRTGPDGDFRVYAFCDEDCRDEWVDDDSTGTTDGA